MERAREHYGGAEFAPLWQVLWQRLSSGRAVGSVRLTGLDQPQRSAIADLLGLDRLPPQHITVPVHRLDTVLRHSVGLDTRGVTEAIVGPLDNRAERRATDRRARDELWAWLEHHPVVAAQPALLGWVARVRRGGLIDGSPIKTQEVLARALAVLAALPADGRPLPAFAAEVCHDTHALDDGTRLSTLVIKALAALHDEPAPVDAEGRRACWERAGIACDALSTTVLTAGLRPHGGDPLSGTLRLWSDAGHANIITLAQLREFGPVKLDAPRVRVVENPSVVAMAVARLGQRCPPLLATAGWPNSASTLLMRQIVATGIRLEYHGDFDGEGIRIAAHVLARTGARPWRMSAHDYVAGVRSGRPDPGTITDAPWDAELSVALREHHSTVYEEHVADQLLADLATDIT